MSTANNWIVIYRDKVLPIEFTYIISTLCNENDYSIKSQSWIQCTDDITDQFYIQGIISFKKKTRGGNKPKRVLSIEQKEPEMYTANRDIYWNIQEMLDNGDDTTLQEENINIKDIYKKKQHIKDKYPLYDYELEQIIIYAQNESINISINTNESNESNESTIEIN